MNYMIPEVNNFDTNIQFNYEPKNECKLPFLDTLPHRNRSKFITPVYRKLTNTEMFLNQNIFASVSWKKRPPKNLVERAYLVCSTDRFLNKGLKHLEKIFRKRNNYPASIYFFKVNNRNTRKRCIIFSKLTIKIPG